MSSNDEQYEILPSDQLLARMMKLARDYPTFVTLTTTQEWFGLPRAGELCHFIVYCQSLSCFILRNESMLVYLFVDYALH